MKIGKEQIEEFKKIYYRKFGEEISDEKAYELGLQLLHLLKVVCRPLPKGHRCDACSPSEKESDFDNRDISY